VGDVEVVARCYAAVAARDMDAAASCFAPDAQWHLPGTSPIAGDHAGWAAIRNAFILKLLRLSEGTFWAELLDIAVGASYVVAVQHATAHARGKVLDLTGCQLMRIESGLIQQVRGPLLRRGVPRQLLARLTRAHWRSSARNDPHRQHQRELVPRVALKPGIDEGATQAQARRGWGVAHLFEPGSRSVAEQPTMLAITSAATMKGRWRSRPSGRRQADAAPSRCWCSAETSRLRCVRSQRGGVFSVDGVGADQPGVCCRAASRAVPSGTPRPVQGSQPGAAVHLPLFPVVMSRNPGGTWPGVAAA